LPSCRSEKSLAWQRVYLALARGTSSKQRTDIKELCWLIPQCCDALEQRCFAADEVKLGDLPVKNTSMDEAQLKGRPVIG